MTYRLAISEAARDQLRKLSHEERRNIGFRLELMKEDLRGDVKKLEGKLKDHYRLRVGTHRVLFRLLDGIIEVYAVKQRKEAYE